MRIKSMAIKKLKWLAPIECLLYAKHANSCKNYRGNDIEPAFKTVR